MWLCLRRVSPLGLHKGILNSLCFLILLIHTKHENNKMKSWTDPTSWSPLISLNLIDWVGKTENLWLIQFVIFKPLSYFFRETIVFDIKASFASRSLSRLIRWYNKPGYNERNLRKGYSIPRDCSWIENYKLNSQAVAHKAVWWGAPLGLRDFSRSNMHDHSTRI